MNTGDFYDLADCLNPCLALGGTLVADRKGHMVELIRLRVQVKLHWLILVPISAKGGARRALVLPVWPRNSCRSAAHDLGSICV
jgi:hypothetical protein